jgi:hypothetical protein
MLYRDHRRQRRSAAWLGCIGVVDDWYVLESERRHGIGTTLLQRLAECFRAHNCAAIESHTPPANLVGRSVHGALGESFEPAQQLNAQIRVPSGLSPRPSSKVAAAVPLVKERVVAAPTQMAHHHQTFQTSGNYRATVNPEACYGEGIQTHRRRRAGEQPWFRHSGARVTSGSNRPSQQAPALVASAASPLSPSRGRMCSSFPKPWAVTLTITIACGVDARAPGLLPGEEDDSTATAGSGGAPGGFAPSLVPSGGAPSARDIDAAAGSTSISAGAGGGSAVDPGGAAGGAMNLSGAAGSSSNVGGATGGPTMPIGGASGTSGTLGTSLRLTPVDGWVDAESNAVGIQGSVFFDVDSNLGGPSTLIIDSTGPAVCVSGVAGPVRDANFDRDWGGLFGIRLAEASPDQIGTWSQITPVGTLAGFTFRLTGTQFPTALLRFQVQDGAGTYYCSGLGGEGPYSVTMANQRAACWEVGGASVTPELPLVSLMWTIGTREMFSAPFDFCIEDLSVVLR